MVPVVVPVRVFVVLDQMLVVVVPRWRSPDIVNVSVNVADELPPCDVTKYIFKKKQFPCDSKDILGLFRTSPSVT